MPVQITQNPELITQNFPKRAGDLSRGKGYSATAIDPAIIAQEIVDDLEAALEQFRLIANDLGKQM